MRGDATLFVQVMALPGGEDWIDVTQIFQNAADGTCIRYYPWLDADVGVCAEMDGEDVLLVDGFTLYDAMTALEVLPLSQKIIKPLISYRSATHEWTQA